MFVFSFLSLSLSVSFFYALFLLLRASFSLSHTQLSHNSQTTQTHFLCFRLRQYPLSLSLPFSSLRFFSLLYSSFLFSSSLFSSLVPSPAKSLLLFFLLPSQCFSFHRILPNSKSPSRNYLNSSFFFTNTFLFLPAILLFTFSFRFFMFSNPILG